MAREPESTVAEIARPALEEVVDDLPLAVRWWDGSETRIGDSPTTIVVRDPLAVRRLLYQPNKLGLGRAFVAGEVDIEGDVFALLDPPTGTGGLRRRAGVRTAVSLWRAARRLDVVGRPVAPPPEEARLGGQAALALARRPGDRTPLRRRQRLLPARARRPHDVLLRLLAGGGDDARRGAGRQAHADLPEARALGRCAAARRRLRLGSACDPCRPSLRRACRRRRRSRASRTQLARARVEAAGVADRVEIRRQDYRELRDGAVRRDQQRRHVRARRRGADRQVLRLAVRAAAPGRTAAQPRHPRARAATTPADYPANSFIGRYVFPDGALLEVGRVVRPCRTPGFEVRDVESLREHYARTLRACQRALADLFSTASGMSKLK